MQKSSMYARYTSGFCMVLPKIYPRQVYQIICLQFLRTETAFLSELDPEGILDRLEGKIRKGEQLEDEELMELIILPLSYRKKEEKEERIRGAVGLAVQIQDKRQQLFALSGILAFTDKVIDRETADRIRRAVEMTQVAMIFEEEKQEAVRQAVEAEKRRKQEAVKAERKKAVDSERRIVMRMIEKGYPTEEIVLLVSGYSKRDVEALRQKAEQE